MQVTAWGASSPISSDVGDEGDVFEEGGEGGFGGDLGVVGGDRAEFEDVLPAVFGVIEFAEEEVLVAGLAEDGVNHLFDGAVGGGGLGVTDHVGEGEEGAAGAGGDPGSGSGTVAGLG